MIRATAPGSVMVTGEHAVVYGHRAIVAAVEQRVTVTLTPRADRGLRITSEIAAPQETTLEDPAAGGVYRFVLAAVALYRAAFETGFDLEITSEINPTLGLGSSAAVTIAALGAVARLAGESAADLHAQALGIVRAIQGRGSGADLAASLMGGMIAYRAPPEGERHRLPDPPTLSLAYAGYKTPTAEVLAKIAEEMRGRAAEFDALYGEMSRSAEAAIAAAEMLDWDRFAGALRAYQGLMVRLGVSDPVLDRLVVGAGDAMAAKISGSGLGDCVLALGPVPEGFVPVALAEKGLVVDG